MKSFALFFVAIVVALVSFRPATGLTEQERKKALSLLQDTRDKLLKKTKGLRPEQLNFKADPSSWSIAECIEHIAIAETNIFGLAETALKTPADPSKRKDVKMSDDEIIQMSVDRSTKRSAPESFKPSGKFSSFEATVQEFNTKRAKSISYINSTSDDLRQHYYDFPFGKVDAYQLILFMAGHSRRHTEQIEEIMKNPNFPKGD